MIGGIDEARWDTVDAFIEKKDDIVILISGRPFVIPKRAIEDLEKFKEIVNTYHPIKKR